MTVRGDWLSATSDHCRDILTLSRKIASTDVVHVISQALDRLPAPDNSLEQIVQRGLLFDAAIQFSRDAHVGFHREYPAGQHSIGTCGFVASSSLDGWPADAMTSAGNAFHSWIERYTSAFHAAHPLTRVLAAEEYIRSHFRIRLTPVLLADALAV